MGRAKSNHRTKSVTREKWFKAIKIFKCSWNDLIPKASFRRLTREIMHQAGGTQLRIQKDALFALQTETERFLVDLFTRAQCAALHAHRDTIRPSDLQLVTFMRTNEVWQGSNPGSPYVPLTEVQTDSKDARSKAIIEQMKEHEAAKGEAEADPVKVLSSPGDAKKANKKELTPEPKPHKDSPAPKAGKDTPTPRKEKKKGKATKAKIKAKKKPTQSTEEGDSTDAEESAMTM